MRIPYEWNHYQYIDYHQHNDWACGWVSLSPFNECFIWDELNISPRTNTTLEIVDKIAEKSGHYKFLFDVIDPLAVGQKSDTKKSDGTVRTTVDDINKYLSEFKQQGVCEGGYFIPGNTKGTRGREQIRHRLRNSLVVKTPFNNEAEDYKNNPDVINIKREKYLPTIWVFAPCKQVRMSLKNWREEKGKPTQAYSHHCTGLEFLMKDAKFRPPVLEHERPIDRKKVLYFQGRR
jgi:hypothetical protein